LLVDHEPGVRVELYNLNGRGLARALTGDGRGAISDFEFFVANARDYRQFVSQRKAWIAALKRGENPFDRETLLALRDQ
jgi:hypothetical protein